MRYKAAWLAILLLATGCSTLEVGVEPAMSPRAPWATATATAPASPEPALGVTPQEPGATAGPSPSAPVTATATPAAPSQSPPPTQPAAQPSPPAATSGPQNTAVASATETPAPEALPVMQISAGLSAIQPGEDVTLWWGTDAQVTGAVSIALLAAQGAQPAIQYWRDLPPTGYLTVTLDLDPRGRYAFHLWTSFPAAQPYYELPFRFACPDAFFFAFPSNWRDVTSLAGDYCPAGPAAYPITAEQPFEGGRMVWLGSDGTILVLYDDYGWAGYVDTWSPGDPESDPSLAVPPARYQPLRGFGKVWRENDEVRTRLGWALEPESSFTGAEQRNWAVPGADVPLFRFVRLREGSVIALTDYRGHGHQPYWQPVIAVP